MQTIARIEWPRDQERPGFYRAVQLDVDGCSYLRFETAAGQFHGEVLRDFLCRLDIAFDGVVGAEKFPAPQGRRYCVRGMGYALIDTASRTADFSVSVPSHDYGIGIDHEHLDALLQETEWKIVH